MYDPLLSIPPTGAVPIFSTGESALYIMAVARNRRTFIWEINVVALLIIDMIRNICYGDMEYVAGMGATI